jgi:deoxyribose-phosphate aldolase
MTPKSNSPLSLDEQQLEALIEEVARQIFCYLGDRQLCDIRGINIDGAVCPGCHGSCADGCAEKTREVVAAGADRVSATLGLAKVDPEIAGLIDHTLLKPEATRDDIQSLCDEAAQFGFASVCVNPNWVSVAAAKLRRTPVKVCTVVGFPLGATLPPVKVFETEQAVKLGAQEIDMVINVGALRSGDEALVEQDIRGVAEAAHAGGAILKVILECALLDEEQIVRGSQLALMAGADFVKTSTGFASGGATAKDVELMRMVVGEGIGVKAAGGIRSYEDLKEMVKAGATRIGASASVKILKQAAGKTPEAAPAASGQY